MRLRLRGNEQPREGSAAPANCSSTPDAVALMSPAHPLTLRPCLDAPAQVWAGLCAPGFNPIQKTLVCYSLAPALLAGLAYVHLVEPRAGGAGDIEHTPHTLEPFRKVGGVGGISGFGSDPGDHVWEPLVRCT